MKGNCPKKQREFLTAKNAKNAKSTEKTAEI